MAKTSTVNYIKKGVKDADDLFCLFTGKRFRNVIARGMELFGEDIEKKILSTEEEEGEELPGVDNPYWTLGIRPDAIDLVVKGAFRSLVREYHPDTGLHPDAKRFTAVVESYNAIMQARAEARKPKEHPERES